MSSASDLDIRPGVAAVVYSEQRILLHHRHIGGGWAPPSGTVEPGETLLSALHREMREETTLEVEVRRLAAVYSDPSIQVVQYSDGRRVHFVTSVFVCDAVGGTLQGSDEADRWGWFEPQRLPSDLLPYAAVWLEDVLAERNDLVVR